MTLSRMWQHHNSTYVLSMEIHFFSKSPAERIGFGLSRMTGGSPGKGALGISICTIQYMVISSWTIRYWHTNFSQQSFLAIKYYSGISQWWSYLRFSLCMAMQLGPRWVAILDRVATHQKCPLRGFPLYTNASSHIVSIKMIECTEVQTSHRMTYAHV